MATNPAVERAQLFAILNEETPADLPVFVETTGEVQLVATGPSAGDRRVVKLMPKRAYDLLQFAPIAWWQTASSRQELSNAINNSWISVPDDPTVTAGSTPVDLPLEQNHEVILWLQTGAQGLSPLGRARMHFDGTNLLLSQNGGPYVNVVDPVTIRTLTYAATVDLDLDPQLPVYRTMALSGDLTLTGSNYGPGRQVSLRLVADGSTRTLTFPSGWVFIGAAAPADLAAGKTAILSLTCYGASESDVVVAYSAEP